MKKLKFFILIFLLTLPATWGLYGRGYYNMHDDLQAMRIYEMERCFSDGQIPCRWSPDMSWGYGQPLFNYYSAFPYYLGAFIRKLFPLSILATVLTLFNISIVVAALGMFLLGSRLWGKKGGLLSAVLYTYAPYHAVDVHVRGALAESYALAVLPFLWLFLYGFQKKINYKNFLLLSFSIFLLLTTHNISTLMYFPFTFIWVVYLFLKSPSLKFAVYTFFAAILGFGLSAFFFLPVLFEKNLIQSGFLTMDYLNYEAHFVTIRQLFVDRSWGFGPSVYGPIDDLSFQIGWPHWFFIGPIILFTVYNLYKKGNTKMSILIILLTALFFAATFLTHLRSIPIWKFFPTLALVQFPWRFLGLVIFFVSLTGGSLVFLFKKSTKALIILVAATILLNVNYFKPWNRGYSVTDEQKFSGLAFDLQQRSAILDYLPQTAPVAPKEKAYDMPQVIEGEGYTSNYRVNSNSFFFDVEAYSKATVQVPVLYFPKWTLVSGGKVIDAKPTGKYGLITFEVPEGKHIIQGRFEDTPVRQIGNLLTIISSLVFFGILTISLNRK